MTFPLFRIRKFERTCGEVLFPDWVMRPEMEYVLSLPEKEYPCAAVMQLSWFCEKSAAFSVAGHSEILD